MCIDSTKDVGSFYCNKKEKEDSQKEIENCCREHLLSLLKYFIEGKEANLSNKNEFVTIASEKGHQEIVQMLLQNQEVIK